MINNENLNVLGENKNKGDNRQLKDYLLYHFLNNKNKEEILTMKITNSVKKIIKNDFNDKPETTELYNLAFIMELYKNNYNGTLWSSVYFKFVEAEDDD